MHVFCNFIDMNIHEQYMLRCIELAQKGAGSVSPNPMVGAVLVHNGVIIGEGWHQQYGGPHAEVNCIASVAAANRHLIDASTLYVSLEPCAHYGKTPPCANLIIAKKIPHVVIGCVDTFSEVSGKGIAMLQAAGIKVITDILQQECRALNKRFFTFHEKKRPYIILKWAQSADGFIGPVGGQKLMLSGWAAQRLVHKLRSMEDSILVGFRTALLDNPLLNNRLWTGKNPVRVVWDKYNTLPEGHHVKDGSVPTIIFCNKPAENKENCSYIEMPESQAGIGFLLEKLSEQNIQSIIVEGGTDTINSFINAGLWDEAIIITANQVHIGNGVKAPATNGFHLIKTINIGNDTLKFYTHEQP